jgi:S-adenosylmethionine decarboxylase
LKIKRIEKDSELFFEGSEKKAQIIINVDKLSLLNDIDDVFWDALVNSCGAKILSSMTNTNCKALLLSESSLFIWHHKLLIITCGTSQLVKAIEFFLDSYPIDIVQQISYQRKNEYFSHAQPSCFSQDVKTLRQYISGKAYRFGDLDSHHNYLFHQDNNFKANINDKSYEIVAYHISEAASQLLTDSNLTALSIRNMFHIGELFADFDIDDHVFTPFGYSLNGINNDKFFTIHITPQAESSYISVSANFDLISLLPQLIKMLAPTTIDVLTSNESNFEQKIKNKLPTQFICTSLVKKSLSIGEEIVFSSYSQKAQQSCEAIDLKQNNEVCSL